MGEIITVWILVAIVLYLGSVLDKLYCILYPTYSWDVKLKHYWEK